MNPLQIIGIIAMGLPFIAIVLTLIINRKHIISEL